MYIFCINLQHILSLVDAPVETGGCYAKDRIRRRGAVISERMKGETIAELTKFTIRYGWADTILVSLVGFAANPHTCGRDRDGEVRYSETGLSVEDLVLAALQPAGAAGIASSRGAERRGDP